MARTVDWPLCENKIRRGLINHTFGMVRKKADGSPRAHQGWDFEARIGTSCYAIATGTVKSIKYNAGDYGTQLLLKFSHGNETLYAFYAHLKDIWVSVGDEVTLGDLLCSTGESGNAKGMAVKDQHLHFEIRTEAHPGLGLVGRRSPYSIYKVCPLTKAEIRKMA